MTSPNHSSDDEEPNPLTIGEEFVQSPNHLAPTTSSIDLDGLLNPPLQLQQDLKEGCGGQLWPAGVVLAKYLLRKESDDLKEKTMFAPPQRTSRPPFPNQTFPNHPFQT